MSWILRGWRGWGWGHSGCGLSTHAWELDVLGVQAIQEDFMSPLVWYVNRGWFPHPGGDFLYYLVIPDPMQSNASCHSVHPLTIPFLVFLLFVLGCTWRNWKYSGFSDSFCSLHFPGRWNVDVLVSGLNPLPYFALLERSVNFQILLFVPPRHWFTSWTVPALSRTTFHPSCPPLIVQREDFWAQTGKVICPRSQGLWQCRTETRNWDWAPKWGMRLQWGLGWAWPVWGRALPCAYCWASKSRNVFLQNWCLGIYVFQSQDWEKIVVSNRNTIWVKSVLRKWKQKL